MMKLLVVDKCRTERQAMVDALAGLEEISVQGAVPDLETAVRAMSECGLDIVVTGVELADASALELIEVAQQTAPAPRIVVIAPSPTRDVWRQHLVAGADRFVERDPELRELREVVTSLASRAGGDEHELRLLLAAIRASVDRASRMTASVLAFVRGQPAKLEPLDLGLVVRAALARVLPSLPSTVAVHADIADRIPPIRGAAGELELMVLSLVFDAIDAMGASGALVVRVQPTTTAAVFLEVCHSAATASRVAGLELARRVVERHAGSIRSATRDDARAVTVLLPTAES